MKPSFDDASTGCAKNYCNWTLNVQVILENVVMFFSQTQCISKCGCMKLTMSDMLKSH